MWTTWVGQTNHVEDNLILPFPCSSFN